MIENNYEKLRCSDNERIILSALINTIVELDDKVIEDPKLYYSMYKRLSDNILTWLPKEVDVFQLEERVFSKRPDIEEKKELVVWSLEDTVEYLNSFEAPPYPGSNAYIPGGL
jgi:hypothetical protein